MAELQTSGSLRSRGRILEEEEEDRNKFVTYIHVYTLYVLRIAMGWPVSGGTLQPLRDSDYA